MWRAITIRNLDSIIFQDLFYISPFYHLVFPFEKFIVTDVDITYLHSINLLYAEFDHFAPGQLYGFSKDMSPLYRAMLRQYRSEHPDANIGDPGDMQGVNTGVVLLHLERMRHSEVFNKYLDHDFMTGLCDKYHFKGFIGDQVTYNTG